MSLQELVIWLPGSSNESEFYEKLKPNIQSNPFHLKSISSYYLSSKA